MNAQALSELAKQAERQYQGKLNQVNLKESQSIFSVKPLHQIDQIQHQIDQIQLKFKVI